MYKKLDDPLYISILENVNETPGIQPCILSDKVGVSKATLNYRILVLERLGKVKLERGRLYVKIFPSEVTA